MKTSEEDLKRSMLERQAKMNPPDIEPGMDDEDGWGASNDDSWGSGGGDDSWGSGGGGDDSWGSGGGSWGDTGAWGTSVNTQPQIPQTTTEDKAFEIFVGLFSGFKDFTKELVGSIKSFDAYKHMLFGKLVIIVSICMAVAGVIVLVFGQSFGLDVLVGSLISLGVGIPIFMFGYEAFQKSGGVVPTATTDLDDVWAEGSNTNNEFINEPEDEDEFLWQDEPESEPFVPNTDEDDEALKRLWDEDDVEVKEEDESLDLDAKKDKILNTVISDDTRVTKAYLYEKINEYLPTHNPTFAEETDLDGTRKFELLNLAVTKAGKQLATGKGEDMPYLISAVEKLFYIKLVVHRTKWLKQADKFTTEIENIYKYHEELGNEILGDEVKGIYALGNAIGDEIHIKIMKGETALVTLKDTYEFVSQEVLGAKVKMPVVLGVDLEGKVIVQDFYKINSILITGMPRSGKSWLAQLIIFQLMAFMSPKDVHFYIFDPKDGISDFIDMTMTHIRKFVTKEQDMLRELKYIVEVEAVRRKKILADLGFKNLIDYKAKYPQEDFPFLYIMIDEVVTLAESMDKETKDEFQSLLLVLVSQLPALGIRIIMVPHVVKDQIIKKSTTDLIPCRISVRGNEAHIESSTGTKPKDFLTKLTNEGDMAVKINNDATKFVHSAVLTTSNEANSDLFEFLTRMWGKMCPESYEGSYAQLKDLGVGANKIAESGLGSSTLVLEKDKDSVVSTPKRKVTRNTTTLLDKTQVSKSLKGLHDEVSNYEDQESFWDD